MIKNLQDYEMNSPFYEKPTLIKNILQPVITNTNLLIDPYSEHKLWAKFKDNNH